MSVDKPIRQMTDLTLRHTDTHALIEATRLGFQIIEPWAQATSEHDQVKRILESMRVEASSFLTSVDRSFKTAQSGYSFARKAEELCNSLLQPTNKYSNDVIRQYIKELQGTASRAYKEASDTSKMFRTNRQRFNLITRKIPTALESIRSEQASHEASQSKAERRASNWGSAASRWMPGGRGSKTESTRSPMQLAGALVSLPVALPVYLLAGSGAKVFAAQAKERERQSIRYADAVKSLDVAVENLHELMQHMDTLADYWREMNDILEDIHNRIDELRNDTLLRMKIRDLKRDWSRVGADYLGYKTELAKLRDFSPNSTAVMDCPS